MNYKAFLFLLASATLLAEVPSRGCGFFVSADFLYWKAHEEGLEFAQSGIKGPSNPNPESVKKGSFFHPRFEWAPGFRVGAGYKIPKQQWEIWLNWTRYNAEAKKSISHVGDVNLDPFFPILDHPRFVGGPLVSASSKLNLRYNTLDLQISRPLPIDRYLLFSPHFGLRAAWIDQRYKINELMSSSSTNLNMQAHELRNTHNFRGIGLRGGVHSLWLFNTHLGLFGNAAFGLIGGRFCVQQKMTETLNTIPPSILQGTYVNTRTNFHHLVPELEAALGLHIEPGTYKDRYHFEVDLGWEYTLWFHQNQLFNYSGESLTSSGSGNRARGNLSLQGFTASAKLYF